MFLFTDTFDDYTTQPEMVAAGWTGATNIIPGIGAGYRGANSIQVPDSEALSISRQIKVGSGTTLRGAFWVKYDIGWTPAGSNSAGYADVMFRNLALTQQMGFKLSTSGYAGWQTYRSSTWSGVQYAGTTDLRDGQHHHIEFECVLGTGTAGSIKMWVDGNLEINQTSIATDTVGGITVADIQQILIGGNTTNPSGTYYANYSHIAIWDETGNAPIGYVGLHRLATARPDGAGSSSQFTPSAGSNFQCVDEAVRDSDTTYVESTTSGHKDLYTYGTFGSTPDGIVGVNVKTVAKNPDIGTKQFRVRARGGTTEVTGATVTLTPAYLVYQETIDKDPDTTAAWTLSGLNAAQFGVEVI